MAAEKVFILQIRGGGEGGSSTKKSKEKSSLSTLQRLIASPGQLVTNWGMEKAKSLYDSEPKFGTELNLNKLRGQSIGISIQAARALASTAKDYAKYGIDRYCSLSEDYLSRQTLSNVTDTLDRIQSGGSSIISGAVQGAAFGPVGAAAGAVIGAAKFGANQYLEYQKRMSQYYQQLNETNFETSFGASKLGLIGGAGTEN